MKLESNDFSTCYTTIVGVYRVYVSVDVYVLLKLTFSLVTLININQLNETNRRPLYNLFINDHNYRQLVSAFITDNQTLIDHFCTNLTESQAKSHILETFL